MGSSFIIYNSSLSLSVSEFRLIAYTKFIQCPSALFSLIRKNLQISSLLSISASRPQTRKDLLISWREEKSKNCATRRIVDAEFYIEANQRHVNNSPWCCCCYRAFVVNGKLSTVNAYSHEYERIISRIDAHLALYLTSCDPIFEELSGYHHREAYKFEQRCLFKTAFITTADKLLSHIHGCLSLPE